MYRLTHIALAFVLFLPASAAHAQLLDIIDEFCADVGIITDDFVDEIGTARSVLQVCFADYIDCQGPALDLGSSECIGDFRRCSERANRKAEASCSDFQNDYRREFDESLTDAVEAGVEDGFLNSPTVQSKTHTARRLGGLCGIPVNELPAPDADTVCLTALCADDSSPLRAEDCGVAVEACRGYSGEALETCVSLGLHICRGGGLAENPPPPPPDPEDPPTEIPNVCELALCALSPHRADECREFYFNCSGWSQTPQEDELCLGASLLYCTGT